MGLDPARCLWIGQGTGAGGGRGVPDFPDMPAATSWLLNLGDARGVRPPPRPPTPPRVYPVLSVVSLRALAEAPLRDEGVRATVASTARAIAERTGIELVSLDLDHASVTARVATHRLAAIGFAAELRRVTNAWHRGRSGEPLWPVREIDPPDER